MNTDSRIVMEVNGLRCAFHMPPALMPKFNDNGVEITQSLPMASARFAYKVDEYPGCPSNWMHGSAKASSYWLPVRPGCGMWLDFNYNAELSHDVAVVVSIQGINPITGQQTKALRLEQYRERCPVHDVPFGQDRFCEQCKYKWEAQNYIASNSTPHGLFWLDGFRGDDGVVRQYVFTEETCKGVAKNIIGEERVFAVGIAFYLSKEPKMENPTLTKFYGYDSLGAGLKHKGGNVLHTCAPASGQYFNSSHKPLYKACIGSADVGYDTCLDFDPMEKLVVNRSGNSTPERIDAERKLLEITAGAKIKQRVHQDNCDLSFWQDEPAGFVYINYCTLEDAEKIMAVGKKEMAGSFLDVLNII